MILKSADDKSTRLALLQDLQQSTRLNAQQKKWLREALKRLRRGIKGEQESAFYLNSYFKDSQNHVLLHDLRFEVDGEVAQIDHLIINRGFGIYLIETKSYAGNLIINEQGEFTAEYDEESFGIPSPLEQGARHERIVRKLLVQLGIGPRVGEGLNIHRVVMLHPSARITRPPAKAFDTSMVIKADQFPSWHKNYVDNGLGTMDVLKMLPNIRSVDTIRQWGEKLLRQHRRADPLALPDFMKPQPLPANAGAPTPPAVVAPAIAPVAAPIPGQHPATPTSPTSPTSPTATISPSPPQRPVCGHCGCGVSTAVERYCKNFSQRFGGQVYCMEHQKLF